MSHLIVQAVEATVGLSTMERWILSVLAHGEETTTKGLATEYYWPEEIPLNGQTVITKTVRRLQKKTARE